MGMAYDKSSATTEEEMIALKALHLSAHTFIDRFNDSMTNLVEPK